MKSNRSEIAKELLTKSGAIKMASLIELWTNWGSYIETTLPKPTFKQLHNTDLKVVDAQIRKKATFIKVLRQWSFGNQPTGITDVEILDAQLDEKRGKRWSIWIRFAIFPIFLATIYIGLIAILITPANVALEFLWDFSGWGLPPDSKSLLGALLIIWIARRIWLRWRFRGLPAEALPVLKPLKKRLEKNLSKWNQEDLQELAELVGSLPNWESKQSEESVPQAAAAQHKKDAGANDTGEDHLSEAPASIGSLKRNASEKGNQLKRKINAKEILMDIKEGIGDTGLMQKYGLSVQQLTVVYKKLEDAGLLKTQKG